MHRAGARTPVHLHKPIPSCLGETPGGRTFRQHTHWLAGKYAFLQTSDPRVRTMRACGRWVSWGQSKGTLSPADHLQLLELATEEAEPMAATSRRLRTRPGDIFMALFPRLERAVGSQPIFLWPHKSPLSHCCCWYLEYGHTPFIRCPNTCNGQALYVHFLIWASQWPSPVRC